MGLQDECWAMDLHFGFSDLIRKVARAVPRLNLKTNFFSKNNSSTANKTTSSPSSSLLISFCTSKEPCINHLGVFPAFVTSKLLKDGELPGSLGRHFSSLFPSVPGILSLDTSGTNIKQQYVSVNTNNGHKICTRDMRYVFYSPNWQTLPKT